MDNLTTISLDPLHLFRDTSFKSYTTNPKAPLFHMHMYSFSCSVKLFVLSVGARAGIRTDLP